MAESSPSGAHQKALELNLERSVFGSFAEIGAGQEVARWFMRVGGASGTVAKTVSAYDKAVSDDLYGAGTRYVSRPRLESMMGAEWESLLRQVGGERRASSRLFTFADTASARNYAGDNLCHAWVGVRFETAPGAAPSDVVVHVNLLDGSNIAQQEALGILGVNLIHAVFYSRADPESLLRAIADGVAPERIGIDVADASGPAFDGWDKNRVQAALAYSGLSAGCVLLQDGGTDTPAEALHKRGVVVLPGRFETVEPVHEAAARAACAALAAETGARERPPLALFALSVEEGVPLDQTLRRAERLRRGGDRTAVFEQRELYRMTECIKRFTPGPIRFAVSIAVLTSVLEERQYDSLGGQLLEAIARLFLQDVRIYVFPAHESSLSASVRALVRPGPSQWVTPERVRLTGPASHLYDYLLEAGFIIPLDQPEGSGRSGR